MTEIGTPQSSSAQQELFDITIIGGGPVGLYALFYAGLRGMKRKLIDSLPELGGQLTALYPEKFIYDMPGFPKVTARALVAAMSEQALRGGPTVCLGERVSRMEHDSATGNFRLVSGDTVHLTRTVVIAAGAGAFTPKKLGRPAVDNWEGRGLHYSVRDTTQFADRDVLIVGGGDSAVDWALHLEKQARSVTLIHRRPEFRAHEHSVARLRSSSNIRVLTPCELRSLDGLGDQLRQAVVADNATQQELALPVDAVLLNLGFSADLGPIKEWGLAVRAGDILVDRHMETSVSGVFACGDVAAYDGKLKLIAVGVGEAAIAVNHAKARIDPNARVFPGHSSHRAGVPGTVHTGGKRGDYADK